MTRLESNRTLQNQNSMLVDRTRHGRVTPTVHTTGSHHRFTPPVHTTATSHRDINVRSPLKHATRSAVNVIPRGAKRSRGIHSGPPDTGPRCSAEGAAQFQPRATPWDLSSDERFPSPEGAAHSSPTKALRARWIALTGLVPADRHGSQGDALGFRSPPRWGLVTRPPSTQTRCVRRVSETPGNRRSNFIAVASNRIFQQAVSA
jgi:hypothetical protein